jgi:flagella basal body P-ring formation protein FlgA
MLYIKMMKKLLLLIFTTIYLQANPYILKNNYTITNETLYSDEIFDNLDITFEIFKMPKNSFVYRVPALNIVNKFKDYGIEVVRPKDYYITFEKEMLYDKPYIKSYIAQKYQEHIKNLSIIDVELKATMKTDLSGFSVDTISLDKYSLNRNSGTVTIKFVKDTSFKNIYFKYKIIGTIKLAIAKTNISTNEPLNNYNVSMSETPFVKNTKSISMSDLSADVCASEPIPQNGIVKLKHIKRIPVIKKGSTVTAYLKIGALQVEFEAVALEDGAKKEYVTVKRIDNGNIYKGLVVNSSFVRIH